jgi:hypothetical protein
MHSCPEKTCEYPCVSVSQPNMESDLSHMNHGLTDDSFEQPRVALLNSIRQRRWPGARYYKPACLLAVLDGVDSGEIDPQHIDPEAVLERFAALVSQLAPEKADLGWRPFWHLSNDGAWSFFKGARQLVPEDYGRERKPNSRGELLNRIDRVSVSDRSLAMWRTPAGRQALRCGLLEMLRMDGDPTCMQLAALAAPLVEPLRSAGSVIERGRGRGGQGFLESAEARKAIELRAMDVAAAFLASEGWQVQDVSLDRPYDFYCIRNDEHAFVEVKGTVSDGTKVLLTAGEVGFSAKHSAHMMLFVVSRIKLTTADGKIGATGGELRVLREWKPAQSALTPISYSYLLPEC